MKKYYRVRLALLGYKYVGKRNNIVYGRTVDGVWCFWFKYGLRLCEVAKYDTREEAEFALRVLYKGGYKA